MPRRHAPQATSISLLLLALCTAPSCSADGELPPTQPRSGTAGTSTAGWVSTGSADGSTSYGSTSYGSTSYGSTSYGSTSYGSEGPSSDTGTTGEPSCWDEDAGSSGDSSSSGTSGGDTGDGEVCPSDDLGEDLTENDASEWEAEAPSTGYSESDCVVRTGECPDTTQWCCDDGGAGQAADNLLAAQPKIALDLGNLDYDPKSVYTLINLGTKEITVRITWKKAATDKAKSKTVKVPAGKVEVGSTADDWTKYDKFELVVLSPKGQLYKQMPALDKDVVWTRNGMLKTAEIPIIPMYSKDP